MLTLTEPSWFDAERRRGRCVGTSLAGANSRFPTAAPLLRTRSVGGLGAERPSRVLARRWNGLDRWRRRCRIALRSRARTYGISNRILTRCAVACSGRGGGEPDRDRPRLACYDVHPRCACRRCLFHRMGRRRLVVRRIRRNGEGLAQCGGNAKIGPNIPARKIGATADRRGAHVGSLRRRQNARHSKEVRPGDCACRPRRDDRRHRDFARRTLRSRCRPGANRSNRSLSGPCCVARRARTRTPLRNIPPRQRPGRLRARRYLRC